MGFIDGFYSFNISINDTEREIYKSLRLKTPKHPYESVALLMARVLAFVHSYEDGLSFSQGLFDVHEPSIWKKDFMGSVNSWIQVGPPDRRKLSRALREYRQARFTVYFYEIGQKELFCGNLNGDARDYRSKLKLFEMDPVKILDVANHLESSNQLMLSIVDQQVYLEINGQEHTMQITEVAF